MLGAVAIIVALVIAIPVAVCMSGAVAAAILGGSLRSDADKTHPDSELIDLNT